MEHKYETYIKCPYCNYEDEDSWEFDEDEGTYTCGSCEEEFNVTREIEVTYSTSMISCEEKDKEHDYQLDYFFVSKRTFEKGIWEDLPEDKYGYNKIMKCSICGDTEYLKLTKEEYEQDNKI
jgi:transcription elongation factor Elf1